MREYLDVAACRDADPKQFWDPDLVHTGAALCAVCPVASECAADQKTYNSPGLWAGVLFVPGKHGVVHPSGGKTKEPQNNDRTLQRIAERRAQVASLYEDGYTVGEIAEQLQVHRQTIGSDLRVLKVAG